MVRKSKMIGREHYFFKGLQDEEKSEIMSSFIKALTLLHELCIII